MPEASRQESTIRDYARLLVRRKWIVLASVALLPTLTVLFALREPPLYQASAKVLLKEGNLAATLSGIQDTSVYLDPARVAQTQIELAQTPAVAARVLRAAGIKTITANQLLAATGISAEPNADILDFSVSNRNRMLAERLVNEYARQYTILRRQIDTAAINGALIDVTRRIEQAKADGKNVYATSLEGKADQLRTFQALENSNAVIARAADGAGQVEPRPKRFGVIGLALGIMLGIGLAFVRDALDTRVRAAEEVVQRLGLPLLARLPEPPRKIRNNDGLVMLEQPSSVEAEAFRVLRTNLEFANLEPNARTIMITSALESEGKSTTVANLAIAAARGGRNVVLVDLDLRRPYIDRFFGLQEQPGLTNVVLGHATLKQAIAQIPIPAAEKNEGSSEGNGHGKLGGVLNVLPSGPIPPEPGEFVGKRAVADILATLAKQYDLVLIDTPPLLHVGDGLNLAGNVDAMLLVARLPTIRRPMLKELQRVLENSPSRKLGFALAGAHLEDGYGYGYYYYYQARQSRSESRRARSRAETV
jgi:succinoglycan biosynthesis transport protein ExoP